MSKLFKAAIICPLHIRIYSQHNYITKEKCGVQEAMMN
jgi:hypothetical protein